MTAPSPRRLERNRVLSFEGMKKGRSVETEEKGDQPLVVTNLLRFFLFALLPTPHYHAYYTALIMDFAFTARLFRSLLATFPTMTTFRGQNWIAETDIFSFLILSNRSPSPILPGKRNNFQNFFFLILQCLDLLFYLYSIIKNISQNEFIPRIFVSFMQNMLPDFDLLLYSILSYYCSQRKIFYEES